MKKTLRDKSEKWDKECEAQRRVDRAGIGKMATWIEAHITKIQKLCASEMTTRDKIVAAIRLTVLVHPDFVKQLHARLAEGRGVFKTKAEDSDVPAKISFSRGLQTTHGQRHLLKMTSLWRDDFDTMQFLDWRA